MAAVAKIGEGIPHRGREAQFNIEVDERTRDLFHAACRLRGKTAKAMIEQFMRGVIAETCPGPRQTNDASAVKTFDEQEPTSARIDNPK